MAKASSDRTELPTEFKSLEEAGLFWDTHSSADYEAFMVPVSLEIDASLDRFYVAVARELAHRLSEYARAQGVTTETLVNLWLQEKLHSNVQQYNSSH
jgi:hypothetical protein